MMRVQLSGKIEVTVDGKVVDLGSNKAQVVLAALALNAGSLVPTGRLVDLVWSEEPPRTAEKTLQAYVARLRKACGAASIERAGDAYRLVVEPDDVDLVRFEQLLDDSQRADALEIWQGPPLAGLAASGLDPTITRFTERFLVASEHLLADEISQGRSAEVVGQLRELAMANPLREGVWALLIRALYASGRQADALRAYSEAREHLVAGLGIEPGRELQELERQVLDQTLQVTSGAVGADLRGGDEAQSFLFTDVADSTTLWERHGDSMAAAMREHDQIITEAISALGGTVFKHTGDGLLATFDQAPSAMKAAVDAQLRLADIRVGDERLAVRMAISSGRADARDGDWFGPPLNIAARLLDAAHGDQIVVSGGSHDQVGNDIDAAITFSNLGRLNLRGLSRPEQVYQVIHPALPRRFSPLRTIISHQPTEAAEFPPQLAYSHGVDFVGRESQKETLHDVWQRVRNSRSPQLVLLAGEPGVGKTRLAAEVAREIRNVDGPLVVYGRCPEDHSSPFRPFTQALTSYANSRPEVELRTELGPHPELLLPVLPWLADRFPDVAEGPLSPDVRQLDIFDAATAFLERASVSPLVMVIDDIHWADQATLDLLLHVVRNAKGGELLVLATYRDVEVDRSHPLSRVLGELRREPTVERVAVRGIDATESVALTEAVLGHELSDNGRSLAENAGVEAGGNPFFLQEMLRHFMEAGVLVREQGRWTAANAETITESVPEGIREVVGRRLDQVSEECNSLLRIASALVDSIDVTLLISVSDFEEGTGLDLLDEALEAGLLIDAGSADQYEFSHALIRQSLYDEFSTSRRLRLHHRIARAIAATGHTDESSVVSAAHHYLAAGPVAPAAVVVERALAAANFSTRRAAHVEASHLLERALDSADGTLDADDDFALLGGLASSYLHQFEFEAASERLETMVGIAATTSSTVLVDVVTDASRALVSRSWSGQAARILGRLVECAAERNDLDRRQTTALAIERFNLRLGGLVPEDLASQLPDMTDTEVERVAYAIGQTPTSLTTLTMFRDRVAMLPSPHSPRLQAATVWLDAICALASWEPIEASPQSVDLLSTGPRSVLQMMMGMGRSARRGDFDTAKNEVISLDFHQAFGAYLDDWAQYEADDYNADSSRIADAIEQKLVGDGTYLNLLPLGRVGPPDEALIRRLAPETTSLGRLPTLIQATWEAGLADLADEFWHQLEPATGLAIPYAFVNHVAAVDHYLGLLAELRGDVDRAIELHLSVISTSRPVGFLIDEGHAAWQLVRLLGQRNQPGDIERARAIAAEALERLEPTTLVRRKRMINEALADLPNANE